MPWPDEDYIKAKMIDYLGAKGFTETPQEAEQIHGVDIQRRSVIRCRYWFIECKGYPNGRYVSQKKYTCFISGIGQIALRMKQEHGQYGVALPYKEYYKDKILDRHTSRTRSRTCLRVFRKRTELYFFLVKRNGAIFKLTPSARNFTQE